MPENPEWPPLHEQLDAAKAPRDSALEKLIKANQDFHILRPEEAHDDLKIPPWLRVWWRKEHPTARHVSGDPSGGYPRSLRRILQVMLHNPNNPTGSQEGEAGNGGKP